MGSMCVDCDFYHPLDDHGEDGAGRCLRFPPSINPFALEAIKNEDGETKNMRVSDISSFLDFWANPCVTGDHRCGEFKAK